MADSREGGRALTLLGLLVGAAIGAAVGLVYAPSTGAENRKRLASWAGGRASNLRDKAKDSLPCG